jgi:ribonuclease HI
MACYVFNQKIYQDKKKLIQEIEDDSIVYKFNNYFEATFFIGQENKDKFKNKIMSVKYLKESLIPTKQKIEQQKSKNINFKSDKNILKVFTDGSSFCNGAKDKSKRKGGIGVFFGDDDQRNVSQPFTIGEITNQRTELYACIKALEVLHDCNQQIEINTDSEYTINCITKWYRGWEANKWKNAKKQPVKNQDLIKQLYQLYKSKKVKFQHVRGHKGIYGNEMADKLAVEGSKMCN